MKDGNIKIIQTSRRRCFFRNEQPLMRFDVMNFEPHNFHNCSLTLEIAGIGIVGTLLILHGREAFRRREGGRYVAALAAAILIPAAVSWVLRGSFRCHIHHYFWALLLLFFFRYDTWFSRCAQAVALGICVDGFVSWGVEPLWYPL